jgi:hypothetical protein
MQTFRFDLLSFWIGFLAATIFWVIISFIRPRIPRIKSNIANTFSNIRARNSAGVESVIRREILKRAQRMHLAAKMFALDEILIKPRLLAPPAYLEKSDPAETYPLIDQSIPYLPEWPELSASYAVTTISLSEAMQKGVNIALIGEPGTGKSVALAHFASIIARKSPEAGIFAGFTPCFVNIQEINLSAADTQEPLDLLIKAITCQFSIITQPKIPRLIKRKLNEKTLLLLLDGLDEMPPSGILQATEFICSLLEKNPSLRIVLASSPYFLDGLLKCGFYPLSMAGWNRDIQIHFLHEWGYLWSTHISPDVRQHTDIEEIPTYYLNNWLELETERTICTPFEWTIKTWLAYSGESNGFAGTNWLDVFIHRCIKLPIVKNAIERLALRICLDGVPSLSYSDCDKFLSGLSVDLFVQKTDPRAEIISDGRVDQEIPSVKNKIVKDGRTSLGGRIIDNLLAQMMLVEYPGEKIGFSHPIFAGYMASNAIQEEPPVAITNNTNWVIARLCLHFLAAKLNVAPWIDRLAKQDQSPLFQDLLMIGRWIKDAPLNAVWRSIYMRKLVSLIQSENVPPSLRARMLALCITANDPSISLLVKQLMTSRSHHVRRLAALAYGALPGNKSIGEILELLVDPVLAVRQAACLALAAIRNPAANDALIDILNRGDESLQQAAAESLAYRGEEGLAILRDAIISPDLLVRRAVVLGLSRIHEHWSIELLEKIAVEDGQWVVRNVAAQALEDFQKTGFHVPEPLPPVSQAKWLLEFAGKQGFGLRPDQPAIEMLLCALKSGSEAERISALRYLRLNSEEGIIGAIYQVAYLEQNLAAEAGLYAVWSIQVSGATMPPLAQYGAG